MSGRRGLRAKLVAGAPSFVQRRLPHAGSRAELAFDLNPRSFSSSGAWIEIAVITSASGQRLASVDLRSLRRRRPASPQREHGHGRAAMVHSQRRLLRRRPTVVVLSLDSTQAALTVDGAELGRIARAPNSPQAAGIVLGPWREGPSASTGYLDIDRVTVREAPAGPDPAASIALGRAGAGSGVGSVGASPPTPPVAPRPPGGRRERASEARSIDGVT